jgi:formylglycine-generating enzyme
MFWMRCSLACVSPGKVFFAPGSTTARSLLFCTLLVSMLVAPAALSSDIEWVTVGDPGNACDFQPQGCFGSVDSVYRVGKYEVTNAQYANFLNAVAKTDPHDLYKGNQGSGKAGISQDGDEGNYTYAPIAGRENMPVTYIEFYDTLRFANWLHNGSLTGAQGSASTEDGAYTITALGISLNNISRNEGAQFFLTSENEWYKAAYYDAVAGSFYDYASQSNATINCSAPGAGANRANCSGVVGDLTAVGAYMSSMSPTGTFDQSGNAQEWNESVIGGASRGLRSGSFGAGHPFSLSASSRSSGNAAFPGQEFVGFRVASVIPEPSTALLVGTGLLGLAAARRRR